jgi:hypothetical protein
MLNYNAAIECPLEEGQSLLIQLDHTGDTRIIFNRANPLEVSIARNAFMQARKDGYMAYKVTGTEGLKGEIMHEFDPLAERMILAPPLKGGADAYR